MKLFSKGLSLGIVALLSLSLAAGCGTTAAPKTGASDTLTY